MADSSHQFSIRLPPARWLFLTAIVLAAIAVAHRVGVRSTSIGQKQPTTQPRGELGGVDSMDKNTFLILLSESKRTDFGKVDFEQQSEAQRVFSAIWELESQVNNGGFDQYFRNSDSDSIAYAPSALRAIGADSCAGIVEQAIRVTAPLPGTEDERDAALDKLSEDASGRLSALDSEFFAYPDDLTELLFRFVSRHPKAFGPVSGASNP